MIPRYRLSAIAFSLLVPAAATVAGAQQVCDDWAQVDPPPDSRLAITEVQARSANDAYAFAIPLGLIHWDGTMWSQFPIGDRNGDYSIIYLREFGLVGPAHIFLAGQGDTGPFSTDQVLKFWDGTSWSDWYSLTLQPNIGGAPRNGAPTAVVGVTSDDIWIVGSADGLGTGSGALPLTVHWDGSELTEFMTAGPGDRQNDIFDAVAIASDDVWAVGESFNVFNPPFNFFGVTYHWDGSSWSSVPVPDELFGGSNLYAVDAIASDDVWAAGVTSDGPLFMHWDGASWTVVPSPATTGTIYQLAAISSDDVWAVDHAWQVPVIGKFYHWDGVEWSIVPPQDVPGAMAVARHGGLAAVDECDVWAVGSVDYGSGVEPFIERLGGTAADRVLPESFSAQGHLLSGTLDDLLASDDHRVVIRSAPSLGGANDPAVSIFVEGTTTLQSPSELRFTYEGQASVPGVAQRIYLFNYAINDFVLAGDQPATSEDSTATVVVTSNVGDFVGPSGLLRARIGLVPSGPGFFTVWVQRVDLSSWELTP